MKTPIVTFFVAALLLIGCSSPRPIIEETPVESQEASIVGGEVEMRLYSQDKADTVESSLEYMFYDNPNLPYQDSVNQVIKDFVTGSISNFDEATANKAELSVEFMEDALQSFSDAYNEEMALAGEDEYFGGVWTSLTSIEIIEENENYVEVSIATWSYEGGVHGNGWSEQIIIDKKTGRELKLADFFSNIDVFTARAEVIFRADQEVPEGESLEAAGFWFEDGVFQLNENFVISEETISFLYNQYEIAPYAAGVIILEIPMEKVKDLRKF